MGRRSPMFLLLMLAACNQPVALQPPAVQPGSEDKQAARAFIARIERDQRYHMGMRVLEIVKTDGASEPLDVIQRGCLELLQQGTPEERRRAARLLARLEDKSAIGPLVKTLNDSDEELRETICYALGWLQAKGEPAESVLTRLRKNDPSTAVRVAAAVTLGRPGDKDAVAAFELGLRSVNADYVRQRCEDELEKIGKLQLPLPEQVYTEISNDKYEEIKADHWYKLQREIRKGDYIYFEAVEKPHHVSFTIVNWYRTRRPSDDRP
jgi:hypothetical protein